MIKMSIIVDGIQYNVKTTSTLEEDISAEKASDIFYEEMNIISKLNIQLEDNSYMVLGKKMIEKTIFIFKEV